MNTYDQDLKKTLLSLINDMEGNELEHFVLNPEKDFKRHRKLGFSAVIRLILSMGSAPLGQELLKYFQFDSNFPSVSASVHSATPKDKARSFFDTF